VPGGEVVEVKMVRRWVPVLGTVLALSSVGVVAGSGVAIAAVPLPSCQDQTWTGNTGIIAVAMRGTTVAWGVRDFIDNGGIWDVKVFVNKGLIDYKRNYTYNPHGSFSASRAPKGAIITFDVEHVNSKLVYSHNVPNGCIVP
jgi:hypothetical protein